MTPIQQLMLGVGAAERTYIQDMFRMNAYQGTGANQFLSRPDGMNADGGMHWFKQRSAANDSVFVDSIRGITKFLKGSGTDAEATDADILDEWYWARIDSSGYSNTNGGAYANWNFKQTDSFFKIVSYTGNGTADRAIAHSLGCVPGVVMIKKRSGTSSWIVFHTHVHDTAPEDYFTYLNDTNARMTGDQFANTLPTSTNFYVGNDNDTNQNGETYIAYVWGGGRSTAATAKSVEFDHNGDWLSCTHGSAGSSDFSMGTGDFTIECWAKLTDPDQYHGIFQIKDGTFNTSGIGNHLAVVWRGNNQNWQIYGGSATSESALSSQMREGQWYHIAYVRASGVSTLYVDGETIISQNDTVDYDHHGLIIGGAYSDTVELLGNISNFRLVKGTAVYTAPFKPPTEPLTNITNTKLLCCQGSSTTSTTVVPSGSSLTANGDPTASSDSPFDDPANFVFGKDGDANVIKCGNYLGTGLPKNRINFGWEPDWILIKRVDGGSGGWYLFDSLRGIGTNTVDAELAVHTTNEEADNDHLMVTGRGFQINSNDAKVNADGHRYIYMCIRRPDPIVGIKQETNTKLLHMATQADSGYIRHAAGFAEGVDMGWYRYGTDSVARSSAINVTSRRTMTGHVVDADTGGEVIGMNSSGSAGTYTYGRMDDRKGWSKLNSDYMGFAFKRYAGFEIIGYQGTGISGHQIRHGLNGVPEMMWVKARTGSQSWICYHSGVTGSAKSQFFHLDTTDAAGNATSAWNDTAPTALDVTLGNSGGTNGDNVWYNMFLFRSVAGMSKLGSYTGNDNDNHTVTLGFQPRLLVIKNTSNAADWAMFNSYHGWASGSNNTKIYLLNTGNIDATGSWTYPTSTGFVMMTDDVRINASGDNYVYWAHA